MKVEKKNPELIGTCKESVPIYIESMLTIFLKILIRFYVTQKKLRYIIRIGVMKNRSSQTKSYKLNKPWFPHTWEPHGIHLKVGWTTGHRAKERTTQLNSIIPLKINRPMDNCYKIQVSILESGHWASPSTQKTSFPPQNEWPSLSCNKPNLSASLSPRSGFLTIKS